MRAQIISKCVAIVCGVQLSDSFEENGKSTVKIMLFTAEQLQRLEH